MPNGFNPASFNPHDLGFLKNPYPTYAEFRNHDPVYPVKPYGFQWVFGYDNCRQILEDKATWVKNPPGGPPPRAYGPYGMMSNFRPGMFDSDPRRHEKLRAAVWGEFSKAIQMAPALAEKIADQLLEAAAGRSRIELISEYALLLPSTVLFMIMGIPDEEQGFPGVREGLIFWQAEVAAAHDITQSPQVKMGGATSSMALFTFFEAMMLGEPNTGGLFAKIVKAFAQTPGLTEKDVQVWAFDFVVAGYLSTTYLIGNGMRNLLENPVQLAELRNDPSLMEKAINEMMRYDGPVQLIDRVASKTIELGSHTFNPGDRVGVVVGSANHDPARFSLPEQFTIARGEHDHLGFGWGIHQCIGEPLVRLVAPVAFSKLLEKFEKLELAGVPQWQTDPYLRAVTNLPLKF